MARCTVNVAINAMDDSDGIFIRHRGQLCALTTFRFDTLPESDLRRTCEELDAGRAAAAAARRAHEYDHEACRTLRRELERLVSAWRNDKPPNRRGEFRRILLELYGTKPEHSYWRDPLRALPGLQQLFVAATCTLRRIEAGKNATFIHDWCREYLEYSPSAPITQVPRCVARWMADLQPSLPPVFVRCEFH